MRRDMDKVIVERPRLGGGRRGTPSKGYKRKMNKIGLEDSPTKEGMTRPYLGSDMKELNEHLSPLYRYLLSKVGQPWNDVFSEICENIRMDSAVQKHVRDHVDGMVVKDVKIVGDKVLDVTGKIIYTGKFYNNFYVCPLTGLLKETPKSPRWRQQRRQPGYIIIGGKKDKQVIVDKYTRYLRLGSIWYLVTFKDMPAKAVEEIVQMGLWSSYVRRIWPTDVVLKRPVVVRYDNVSSIWGDDIYAVAKKQIGKREIRDVEKKWADSIKA